LHRCFHRHGISRLPETRGDKPARKKFKSYPIGYFHIDIAEVRTEEGKLYLFVAIDRTSKFAYAELHEKANRWIATDFLRALIKVVPYKIHTVLTDNGIQFTTCRRIVSDRRHAGAPICSTCSVTPTASSTG
jgi:transposase-like protein